VTEPELLLLDEPFSALDGPLRRSLRRELRRLQAETRIAVLYVTHQIEDVCALGHRLFVMKGGRLQGSFDVESLFDPDRRGEAWGALGWGNLLRGELRPGPDGSCRFVAGPIILRIYGDCPEGSVSVFVAPDRVKILYPGLPVDEEIASNTLAGQVEDLIPLGDRIRLEVSAGGRIWQVEHQAPSYRDLNLRPGSPVTLAIPPRRIEILRRSESGRRSCGGSPER
jgi:molybdate transport system ATP-binding protein